jgi:hypothetical protein
MVTPCAVNLLWLLGNARSYASFAASLDRPEEAQERILMQLLRDNGESLYGRQHGLADIKTYAQFRRRAPMQDYDDLDPWVQRIRKGESNVLTREGVRRLVPTSGSSGARKLIPYTCGMQDQLNAAIAPWVFSLYVAHPGMLSGRSYWSVSPVGQGHDVGQEPSAVPIGFDDDVDYLGGWRARLISAAMAVPSNVRLIPRVDDWRHLTLLHLLARSDLGLVSVWHPSFLALLMDYMENHWPRLLEDLSKGLDLPEGRMTSQGVCAMALRPNPARVKALAGADPREVRTVWPRLKVVSCWGDAAAEPAMQSLALRLGEVHLQPKGLLATEGVISIPFEGSHPLAIRSHFLEFEDEHGKVHPACDVQHGGLYRVLVTTAGGLCRYRMQDLVRVDGKVGRTPSIRFVGKDGLVCDLVGEKLTDGFVARVLDLVFETGLMRPKMLLLAPDLCSSGPCYTVYTSHQLDGEQMARIEQLLCANPQYAYARRLGQLGALRQFWVRGDFYASYSDHLMGTGMRLGDIKPSSLSRLNSWSSCFHGGYVGT